MDSFRADVNDDDCDLLVDTTWHNRPAVSIERSLVSAHEVTAYLLTDALMHRRPDQMLRTKELRSTNTRRLEIIDT